MQSGAFWDNFEKCHSGILLNFFKSWSCSLSCGVLRQGILSYFMCTDLVASGWFFQYSYLYTVMITIHLGGGSWAFWGGSFYPSNTLDRTLHVSTFYPLVIWSCMFWPSVMWNLCKAQHKWGKSIWIFDCCRPQLPNLWLLLVILIFFNSKPLPVTFCFIINGRFSRVGHWTCINAYFHKHIHDLLITLLLK